MSDLAVLDFVTLTPWLWLAIAAALAGLELVMPGAFMIWMAGAAVVSAGVAALLAPGWPVQVVLFVGFSVASVLIGRAWLRAHPTVSRAPFLNRRAEKMIGIVVTVVEPLSDGQGRVQVGDSPWPATGPDMGIGTRARVVRVDGTTLGVEPA